MKRILVLTALSLAACESTPEREPKRETASPLAARSGLHRIWLESDLPLE